MATPYHIKVPWTRQPPAGTPLDLSNELVKHMTGHYPLRRAVEVNNATMEHNTTRRNAVKSTYIVNTYGSIVPSRTDRGEALDFQRNMSFTNLHDAIQLDNVANMDAGPASAFSWSAWFKMSAADRSYKYMIACQHLNNGTDYNWGCNIRETGLATFFVATSTPTFPGATSTTTLDDLKWHHIVGTYDQRMSGDNEGYIYIDGVQEGSWTTSLDKATQDEEITIGRQGNTGDPFNGWIQEFCYWHNHALTPAQVRSLYENQWQIYQPQTIPIYVPAAAASTTYYSIKVPWTRQPPDGIKLDMSNPLLRDCTVHFPFRHVVEASAAFCERNTTERNSAELLYDLNVNNSVSLVGTDRGQALELIKTDDGSSDYLYCNKQSTFSGGGSDAANYSFSVWFRCRTDQTGKNMFVFESYSSGSNSGPNLRIYGDDLLDCVVYLTTGFLIAGDVTNVVDDKWHHVVGTWDTRLATNEFKLYLDGVLNDTKTSSYDAANQTTTWQWFALGNGSTMGGKIQEFMWWHERVLTAAEVKSLYDNQWQIYQPQTLPIYVPAAAPPAAARRFLTLLGVS